MNYNYTYPFAIPTLIPSDVNIRVARASTLFPDNIIGPYTTWKLPVRVATTENIVLNGNPIIDNIQTEVGDRVLVKNQSLESENGIYVVSTIPNEWKRTNDLQNGIGAANATLFVSEGSTNSNKMFICTNRVGNDIVGIDELNFLEYSSGGGGGGGTPGGSDGNVQYNDNGVFAGSNLLNFNTSPIPANPPFFDYNVEGTLTIGRTSTTNPSAPLIARITAPDSEVGDGTNGGSVFITGSAGNTYGGNAGLLGGNSTNIGGNVIIKGGGGVSTGGDVKIHGGQGGTTYGMVDIITSGVPVTFAHGGISFVKDELTIPSLSGSRTVTTSRRQGIITIGDSSGIDKDIVVECDSILPNDTVRLDVVHYSNLGMPMPRLLYITDQDFAFNIYNTETDDFIGEMKILFQLL